MEGKDGLTPGRLITFQVRWEGYRRTVLKCSDTYPIPVFFFKKCFVLRFCSTQLYWNMLNSAYKGLLDILTSFTRYASLQYFHEQ